MNEGDCGDDRGAVGVTRAAVINRKMNSWPVQSKSYSSEKTASLVTPLSWKTGKH